MKKILLYIILLSATNLFSQTLATSDTLTLGDSYQYYAVDTSMTDLETIVGTGITWDYSGLLMAAGEPQATNTVIDISNSPSQADFPNAQYQEQFDSGIQTFFSNSPSDDKVIIDGYIFTSAGADYIVKYDTDEMIGLELPMSFGSEVNDNVVGEAIVPLLGSITLTGTVNVIADGTGSLVLGSNTYSDVIRIKTTENSSGPSQLGTISVERKSYAYYSPNDTKFPLFIYGEILVSIPNAGVVSFKIVWSKDDTQQFASISQSSSNIAIDLYPNPADENVTIESPEGTQLIEIYNTVGKVVESIENPPVKQVIDTKKLNAGIYFVSVKSGNSTTTKKLVIK